MVGYLYHTGARGRVRLESYSVRGLTVLSARLPGTAERRGDRRRTARALRLLGRAGCRRLLAPCALDPALPVVHTGHLWQAMAVPLALAALRQRGIPPERAVLALRGDRPTRPYRQACLQLARQVRALCLQLEGGETLGWQLQRQLGVPLLPAEEAALTLSFCPGGGSESACLCLGGEDPAVDGFTLDLPGLALPPGCPTLPLLAALLDAGRLPLEEVQVLPLAPRLSAARPDIPALPEIPRQRAPR